MNWQKWLPTRKWWGQLVTTAGAITVMLLTGDGINTDTEVEGLVGLVVALAVTYIIPNKEDSNASTGTNPTLSGNRPGNFRSP